MDWIPSAVLKALVGLSSFPPAAPALPAHQELKELMAPCHYVQVFLGQSELILGSEDPRVSGGIGYAFGRLEPRFQFQHLPAQLVYEAYYEQSYSRGASGVGHNQTAAVGVIAKAMYRWPTNRHGVGAYLDIGVGVQAASMATVDLSGDFNSTPTLGVGFTFKTSYGEGMLGLRYLHISDGGTHGNNQGQNQFCLAYMVRY